MPTTYFQISTLFCFASKIRQERARGWYFGLFFLKKKYHLRKVHDPSSIQEHLIISLKRLLKKILKSQLFRRHSTLSYRIHQVRNSLQCLSQWFPLLLQSRLYTTIVSPGFFFIYWELGSPLVVLKFNLEKKNLRKKSGPSNSVKSQARMVSSYYTRRPAGAQAVLWHLTRGFEKKI